MDRRERVECLRVAPSLAAFGGGAETVEKLAGGLNALAGSLDVVRVVDRPEVQLGTVRDVEVLEGPDLVRLRPSSDHGHVQPMQRTVDIVGNGVGDPDETARTVGLFEVLVVTVPVTQVVAELDGFGDVVGEADQPLVVFGLHVVEMRRPNTLDGGELDGGIPLDRQNVVGDVIELRQEFVAVGGLESGLVVGH